MQHADGERDRFGAGPQAGLLEAAEELRRELDAVPHDQRADAERAVEFVGGDAHRGHAQCAKIDRQFADDLGGVGVQRHAVLRCRWRPARRPVAARRFRCGRGSQHTSRVSGRSSRGNSATRSTPLLVDAEPVDLPAGRGPAASASAVMLGCSRAEMMMWETGGEDAPARWRRAADRQVVGLGAAAGEDDAVGVAARHVRADQFADPLAGVFQHAPRPPAELVLAGRIQVRLGVAGAHRLDHLRQQRRGGVVVEIDR